MKRNCASGISLITLIITIIVIIILAAVVIFTGLNTPDKANFAKFVQEISDFRTAIQHDYAERKMQYSLEGKNRTDAQIYYLIASGGDADDIIDINIDPYSGEAYRDTTIISLDELGVDNLNIDGEFAYQIIKDSNVKGWNKDKKYYDQANETHWITDKGDVFVLKGYRVEDNGTEKWYLNEKAVSYVTLNSQKQISSPDILKTKWEFEYSGDVEEFVAPFDGIYRLQVWGAQGGTRNNLNDGGKGGFSNGYIELKKDDILYICVGGTGSGLIGGYNGGGTGGEHGQVGAGGGGATHIAIGSNRGELKNYSSNTEEILIVAGGGGGSGYSGGAKGPGGAGGGTTAGTGYDTVNKSYTSGYTGIGATSTQAGGNGSFGQGGNFINNGYGGNGGRRRFLWRRWK